MKIHVRVNDFIDRFYHGTNNFSKAGDIIELTPDEAKLQLAEGTVSLINESDLSAFVSAKKENNNLLSENELLKEQLAEMQEKLKVFEESQNIPDKKKGK